MSDYTIEFTKAAKKQFEKLPNDIKSRFFGKIDLLRKDPKPNGIEKLTDFELEDTFFKSLYRIRVGDYRVVYAIEDNIVTITIVRIKHRREVYG